MQLPGKLSIFHKYFVLAKYTCLVPIKVLKILILCFHVQTQLIYYFTFKKRNLEDNRQQCKNTYYILHIPQTRLLDKNDNESNDDSFCGTYISEFSHYLCKNVYSASTLKRHKQCSFYSSTYMQNKYHILNNKYFVTFLQSSLPLNLTHAQSS